MPNTESEAEKWTVVIRLFITEFYYDFKNTNELPVNRTIFSKSGQLHEVSRSQLATIDVVFAAELFVLGVRTVIALSHRQQDHVFPGQILRKRHGNFLTRANLDETIGYWSFLSNMMDWKILQKNEIKCTRFKIPSKSYHNKEHRYCFKTLKY